jgi:hypothetical protein
VWNQNSIEVVGNAPQKEKACYQNEWKQVVVFGFGHGKFFLL